MRLGSKRTGPTRLHPESAQKLVEELVYVLDGHAEEKAGPSR